MAASPGWSGLNLEGLNAELTSSLDSVKSSIHQAQVWNKQSRTTHLRGSSYSRYCSPPSFSAALWMSI
jgi:hypothetical protein